MYRTMKYTAAIALCLVVILGSFVVHGTLENNPMPSPNSSLIFVLRPHHQLQIGSEVMYQGLQIGAIEELELVDIGANRPVKIAKAVFEESTFPYLYREMDFILTQDNARSGWWYVEIEDVEVNEITSLAPILGFQYLQRLKNGRKKQKSSLMMSWISLILFGKIYNNGF